MEIERLVAGVYAANCYLVHEGDKGFIVDPGGQADKISRKIDELGFKPEFILLTHGHVDHIGAVEDLRDMYTIPVLIHEDDGPMVEDRDLNLSNMMPSADACFKADKTFKDGDILYPGEFDIKVLHTPGHTAGGSCFIIEGSVLTGDTLFKGSVGRTDLATADPDQMVKSLKKLKGLDEKLIVYPGHGADTTIGEEKKSNQFLNK